MLSSSNRQASGFTERSLDFDLDFSEMPRQHAKYMEENEPTADDTLETSIYRTDAERKEQAEADIRHDVARYGRHWSEGDRRTLVQQRIKELEDLDRWMEASVELHRMKLEVEFDDRRVARQRHDELVATVERGNTVAKVFDFAMAHPFLTGFLGTALLDRLQRRRF